jgi:PAS domain S-box-containing protein
MLKSKMIEPNAAVQLRQQAEKTLRDKTSLLLPNFDNISPDDINRMFHELQVHRIELEMQNDELRRAQDEVRVSQQRYFDFYDIAPVGYLTVDEKGIIHDANLTIATFLGLPRQTLVGKPLTRFIVRDDQDIFYRHKNRLFENHQAATCELQMRHKDNSVVYTRLNAIWIVGSRKIQLCAGS